MASPDRTAVTARPTLSAEWPYIAGLAAFFVIAAVAVDAHLDVPVIDDWTYAWSVEQLLRHGRLAVLDWSSVFPVGPAVWGAAWSLVFGFSFGTLRASTLTLALAGVTALYLILRELGASRTVAVFGALTVAANPAFLLLSSSFMTDVPFVAFTLLALLGYVRAARYGEPAALWWAGLWGLVSVFDRQVGVLVPVAGLPLLLRPTGRITRTGAAAALAVTWTAMTIALVVMSWWLHPTSEMHKLIDRLMWLFLVPAGKYAAFNLLMFSTMALYALPALLVMATMRRLWRSTVLVLAAVLTTAVSLAVLGEIPNPLQPGNTWTLDEVGGARQLLSGAWPLVDRDGVEWLLRAVGLAAASLAVAAMWRRQPAWPGRDGVAARVRDAAAAGRAALTTPRGPLVVYFAGYFAMANVLWFYNDRYVLAMLPVGVALLLGHHHASARVPRHAWAALALFAAVAVTGTRDTLRVNQEIGDTWRALVASGVRPSDIDAGYAWSGWLLYAHPENLAAGQSAHTDVPWITSRRKLPYLISKGRLDGYDVARDRSWDDDAPWPEPDRLLVLKRRPPQAAAQPPPAKPSRKPAGRPPA